VGIYINVYHDTTVQKQCFKDQFQTFPCWFLFKGLYIIRCSSCSSVSKKHFMDPSMSVVFHMGIGNLHDWESFLFHIGTGSPIVGTHCCATITLNHISARMAEGATMASHHIRATMTQGQQWPQITLVKQWPTWCGMKNTTGMSVCFKEYTFPILSFLWQCITSVVCPTNT
jgi:hypothetical protein